MKYNATSERKCIPQHQTDEANERREMSLFGDQLYNEPLHNSLFITTEHLTQLKQ